MKRKSLRVCVVIPAYNEGKVIQSVVKRASKVFDDSKKYFVDIVVVDDGSTDDTVAEAQKAGYGLYLN